MRDTSAILIVSGASLLLSYLYYSRRRPRWRELIAHAMDYHRYHLTLLRRDGGIDDRSRELAHAMFMVVDRQFRKDLKGAPGLRGVFKSFSGERTALASLGETWGKIFIEKIFTGSAHVDDRLERLHDTMTSMIYRYYLLTSALGFFAVLYMDLTLALAILHADTRGSSRLFRDLARGRT